MVLVALLVIAFLVASAVVTEMMWFDQLGFLQVLITQWIATAVMFLIGFLAMAVPVFFAVDIAYRKRPVYARLTAQLDRYQELFEPLRRVVKWALPTVIGLIAGVSAAAQWPQVLLWLNREGTGTTDAQFGMDVAYFLFDLPLLRSVVSFASAVVLISLIVGAATSYLYGGITISGREVRVSKTMRIQVAVLATIYLALQAGSLWLDQYATLNDPDGLLTGAMYSDVHAVIPSKQILAGIAVLVAILFLVTAFTGKWRLPVIGTALFLASSLVIGVGYPWAIQRFQVVPDERSLEQEYVQRNLEATSAAYGIDEVEVERYDAVTDAEPGALRDDAVTAANIRILDPEVVSRTFSQLEQSRQYYAFPNSLNVDRYEIDGQVEDTVSAVRDINIEDQEGWYNRTLVYTHGYGLVAAFGNQRSPGGEPVFLENGIPTSGVLGEFEPRVYFGVNSPEYSIVGGERENDIELDYPADGGTDSEASVGDEPAEPEAEESAPAEDPTEGETAEGEAAEGEEAESGEEPAVEEDLSRQNLTTFDGDGGPVLSNIFTKMLYALKFQDMEVLLSGAVVDGSQILYDRDPLERVQKVAPYLTVDEAPYASVVDGKIVWIVDGYTTSSEYPYSEIRDMNEMKVDRDNPRTSPAGEPINYIRNSVKATVDAHDGSVTLYTWDTDDPVLKAWSKVFPSSLEDMEEMSGELLSHVRYPTDMFKVQRDLLSRYHVDEPDAFYSAEDAWRTPDDPVTAAGGDAAALPQPPYYLTLAAGEGAEPDYSIYSTYIPDAQGEGARDILTGYLAANANAGSEPGEISDDYGTLKLLTLPSGDTQPGPGQVQNAFNTDPTVSTELNILRQGETRVISGNLLTLPVGGGLLYVQPVYIEASSGTQYPLLQKILVSFGDDIAFEDTLDEALDELFGGDSGANAGDGGVIDEIDAEEGDGAPAEEPAEGEEPATDEGSSTPGTDGLESVLQDLQQALNDREQALQDGDWSAYGEADDRLKEAIDQLLAAEE